MYEVSSNYKQKIGKGKLEILEHIFCCFPQGKSVQVELKFIVNGLLECIASESAISWLRSGMGSNYVSE